MSRRTVIATAAALGTALVASPVLAAGEEHHGPGTVELLWQAANLALLLGVVVYAARRPVQRFFAERRERIQGQLEESADLLKQAEARYSEWQRRLVGLETELEKIRGMARQRANEERDRILQEARASAERIKQDARAAIDQELRRAQGELREEASDLAVELAGRLISDQIGDTDRSRLVEEFIARIEQPQAGSNRPGGSR